MAKVLQDNCVGTFKETREAVSQACTVLGYSSPTLEASEVIDFLGETDSGARAGRLASFYPASMTVVIDRAARLARAYPEALLSDGEQRLLDLMLRTVVS